MLSNVARRQVLECQKYLAGTESYIIKPLSRSLNYRGQWRIQNLIW